MSDEMTIENVIEVFKLITEEHSVIQCTCDEAYKSRGLRAHDCARCNYVDNYLVESAGKAIAYLETLKPSGRTVQEIREYCGGKIKESQNLFNIRDTKEFLQDIIDFLDSGEEKEGAK